MHGVRATQFVILCDHSGSRGNQHISAGKDVGNRLPHLPLLQRAWNGGGLPGVSVQSFMATVPAAPLAARVLAQNCLESS